MVFISVSYVGFDHEFGVRHVDVQELHRHEHGDETATRRNDLGGIGKLERRLRSQEVADQREDRVEEPKADAELVGEPPAEVVAEVEDRADDVDERPEQRLDQVLRPTRQRAEDGVERRVDRVVEQVADDVGDVEEVDVDRDRIDEDLPVVRDARIVRVPVVHAGGPARVDAVFDDRPESRGKLEPDERRDVQAEVDVGVRAEDADLRGAHQASVERDADQAEAADADLGNVDREARAQRVELQVELVDADAVVRAHVERAVLEVTLGVVAEGERAEALAAALVEPEVVADAREQRARQALGDGHDGVEVAAPRPRARRARRRWWRGPAATPASAPRRRRRRRDGDVEEDLDLVGLECRVVGYPGRRRRLDRERADAREARDEPDDGDSELWEQAEADDETRVALDHVLEARRREVDDLDAAEAADDMLVAGRPRELRAARDEEIEAEALELSERELDGFALRGHSVRVRVRRW